MKNYEKKFKILCEHQKRVFIRKHCKDRPALAAIVAKGNGICPIAFEKNWSYYSPTELHHARAHNTKANRKRWPLFIDSMLNLTAVSRMHTMFPSYGKISDIECWKYEKFLRRHPKIAKYVNGEI